MEFSLPEYQLLRAGLDALTIRGADAQLLANLQIRLEVELQKMTLPPKDQDKLSK
jgi:hypothetical protein